ncbi:hypothetical protein ABC304_06785 [Microbacterium sp. 1P10UB]|uniref:Uncharacterized protein n=1 Tax=Microbacterium lemovicicum TaxID=1072463 RepID=A0A3S9WDH3_9MICO|nr:hypothetical protein [Microbacterium lemovicicum]AZS38091.1 hypothetical protein CVS47_02742 [Microbacterium lemovicicum]
MSATNPESEYESLVHVMRRLSSRYPLLPEDELLAATVDEFERFDGVRLRAYVPTLVERSLRERFRATYGWAA